jgi:hypothetical protein
MMQMSMMTMMITIHNANIKHTTQYKEIKYVY